MKDFVEQLKHLVEHPRSSLKKYKEAQEMLLEHIANLDFSAHTANGYNLVEIKIFQKSDLLKKIEYTMQKDKNSVIIRYSEANDKYSLSVRNPTDPLVLIKDSTFGEKVQPLGLPVFDRHAEVMKKSTGTEISKTYSKKVETYIESLTDKIISKLDDMNNIDILNNHTKVKFLLPKQFMDIYTISTAPDCSILNIANQKKIYSNIELHGDCPENNQVLRTYYKLLSKYYERRALE